MLQATSLRVLAKNSDGFFIESIDWQIRTIELDKQEVKQLFSYRVGDWVTQRELEEKKVWLEKLGFFVTVDLESFKLGNEERRLEVRLIEGMRIRQISVRGNYPFLKKKLIRLSGFKTGNIFDPAQVIPAERKITSFLIQNGYLNANVSFSPYLNEKYRAIRLVMNIEKGKIFRVGQVVTQGNTYLSDRYFENKVRGWGNFRPKRVRQKLKKARQTYIDKGFVRARVRLNSTQYNLATQKIDLDIQVKERKQLIVHFAGNHWFVDQTLKRYLSFYQERGYDRLSLISSRETLLEFYRLNGFLLTKIKTKRVENKQKVHVYFNIDEGPRSEIRNIKIKGNRSFSDGTLKKLLTNKEQSFFKKGYFRADEISVDLEKIVRFYQSYGYFDAQISGWSLQLSRHKDKIDLTIEVIEGDRYQFSSYQLIGAKHFSLDELEDFFHLKNKKYFQQKRIERSLLRLNRAYLKAGYAYHQVRLNVKKDSDQKKINLIFEISEGLPVTIGQIIISGDYVTKKSIILTALKSKTGDLFSEDKMLDSQLRLKRLGVFDYVRIVPVGIENKSPVVDLLVSLKERKTIVFDAEVGLDSEDLFSAQASFTKRNLFGYGLQWQLKGRAGVRLSRLETTSYLPELFGSDWNFIQQFFIERRNTNVYNANQYGGSVGLIKDFGPNLTFLTKTQIARFNIDEDQSSPEALQDNLYDNTFLEFLTSVAFDSRDNFADPKKGLYLLANAELNADLSNLENMFYLTEFSGSYFFSFNPRLTMTHTLRVGQIFNIGNQTRVPATKLFFAGGSDTIRGFREDELNDSGGTTSIIYNVELALRIFGSFKLAGFFDMASLTDGFDDVNRDSFRESAGVGLRYITPVGPIRFDYGFVLDPRAGESDNRFHFSFGYFF